MSRVVIKALSAGMLILGVAVGAREAACPLVRISLPRPAEAQSGDRTAAPRVAAESLAGAAVARDPFRIARRPAAVEYDPLRTGQPAAPTPPKPTLALVGTVWDGGSDPTALLEGLPGIDGPRVVRRGETIGAFRVKRIDRDRVVIVGLDTTWTLTVREPWK